MVPIILFCLSISTRGIEIHFWVISEALKHVSDSLRITKGLQFIIKLTQNTVNWFLILALKMYRKIILDILKPFKL